MSYEQIDFMALDRSFFFVVFFGILFIVILHIILCLKAAGIARRKGHHGAGWFFLCFFTGICGFVLVAGLPDLVIQHELKRLSGHYGSPQY